jgi:hypothetical protein
MDLIESKNKTTDHRHPWELSRAACVLSYVDRQPIDNLIDIGAGDQFVLNKVKSRVSGGVYAVDSHYHRKKSAKVGVTSLQDVKDIPLLSKTSSNNVVLMMDVLEHVKNDVQFLRQALKKVPQGTVIVTVPAWQFLFSDHDRTVKHHRRYNRKRLVSALRKAGLEIDSVHYFYCALLPPRLVQKVAQRLRKDRSVKFGITKWGYAENHPLTRLVRTILTVDFRTCQGLAKAHIYLPGLSLIAVCRKKQP